ncbi:MAG: VWA domain-containing protein [Rhodospirillaceae bacterium]|nr:VWA domain-containing protein [Rhodospirillaceae bacterium]MDD9924757.1 VWA domain-containing protein [Rhodospirillaceae bacterium]
MPDRMPRHFRSTGMDKFPEAGENAIKRVFEQPVSTFSVDVDTASYSFVRRTLNRGSMPPKDAVRLEELINYFDYNYPQSTDRSRPFQPSVTVVPSPWREGNKLIHVGIKGYDIDRTATPRANLVFLLDVSGSMNAPDKLPLMVNSMKLLLDTLEEDDTVAIVVYAGAAGTVLEPTEVIHKRKIISALNKLRAGGSTAGGEGLQRAYDLAEEAFDPDAVNRVILATDGDFNVGVSNTKKLKAMIERRRKAGIYLSVLGFGSGNLNDELMQALAQNGNGVAAHIDNLNEARKVLVEEATSNLFPIAKDVKIQVEFNPARVAEYRLIGYETRALKREDFRNDKIDAGDIGAGHSVTAIYEITPVGSASGMFAPNRYKRPSKKSESTFNDEYAFLKIRYKLPNEDKSRLIDAPITTAQEVPDVDAPGYQDTKWATAIAAFGQLLKGGKYMQDFGYDRVIELARTAKGEDEFGYRAEFINLARLARSAAPSN